MNMFASLSAIAPPDVRVTNLTKRFGSFRALDSVSLHVRPGSFHALLGENGAGKSTLVKCLMGTYRADAGNVLIDDKETTIASPRDAQARGLGMVYQHFTLVPSMTVAENLILGAADLPLVVDWEARRASLRAFMADMPFRLDLEHMVSALSAGEKQKLEILKQLYLGSRFLILDEPTSVLTPDEADQILGVMRDLTQAGRISVVLISHKLREVDAYADAVTVLRNGIVSGRGEVAELKRQDMVRMMVGEDALAAPADRKETTLGPHLLAVDGLTVHDDKGIAAVRDLSLSVRGGEIVGIAGVSGNGQTEFVEALAGQRAEVAGTIQIAGKPYGKTRAEMRALGVKLLPEAPLSNACVRGMSVAENLALRDFDCPPMARGGIWMNRRAMRSRARDLIFRFRIKTQGADAPIETLSGGNVQRTVLARELSEAANVLIVQNPCFGLDLKAVADIRRQIIDARNAGTAVLLISEDLDEILELADTVLVMSEGQIVHRTPRADASLQDIGRHMAHQDG